MLLKDRGTDRQTDRLVAHRLYIVSLVYEKCLYLCWLFSIIALQENKGRATLVFQIEGGRITPKRNIINLWDKSLHINIFSFSDSVHAKVPQKKVSMNCSRAKVFRAL